MRNKLLSLFINKNNKGFTLIELIVAFALLGIVTLIVFSMQSFSLRVFNRGSDRYQVQSSTGIVTEYITQRLRYAYKVVILENAALVPTSGAITTNDAYIFIEDGSDKDAVLFRDKNGTSELSSFDSCQLNFTTAASDRSLSFNISGVLEGENFEVDSGIVSVNLLLDEDRKITFSAAGITSGQAVKIENDPIAPGGGGLIFNPASPTEVATVDMSYNTLGTYKFVAEGGLPAYSYTAYPRLPYGMSINQITGAIFGKPIEPGVFEITIVARDSSDPQKVGYSSILSITVNPAGTLPGADAPKPAAVNVSGNITVGGTLSADVVSYLDSDADDAVTYSYQWYIGPNSDGRDAEPIMPLSGSQSRTYVIKPADENQFIFVKVVAIGVPDGAGMPVFNSFPVSIINAKPEAQNVNITINGNVKVGRTLTGSYTYYDANSDTAGIPIIKWYRSEQDDASNLSVITGATQNTYTLTTDDLNKYIYFSVQPVASTGTYLGDTVISACKGPVNP